MIVPADIAAALRETLEAAFPGEPVYEDVTPRDFERPSNLLELTGIALDPGYGCGAAELRFAYLITTFSQVDEVHDSHLPLLDLRAMTALAAFGAGYVKTGDRALKVETLKADTSNYDSAAVTLELSLAVDRGGFAPEEIWPLMEILHLKTNDKEETT